MSLTNDVSNTLENFDKTSSEQIIDVLEKIKNTFQSNITKEYLDGKLENIRNSTDEEEKKLLCENLKPYFNWYLEKS